MIADRDVAELYMKVISALGVDYSPAKTHNSEKFYEFAKRIIYKGQEVTPFPVSALRDVRRSSDTLVTLLMRMRERGYEFPSISSSVRLYFSLVLNFRSKLSNKIALNSYYFEGVLSLTQGIVPALAVFNDLLGKNNLPNSFFKPWMALDKVVSVAYGDFLQKSVVNALKEIKNFTPTSVMKSNTILKSYYAFIEEYAKENPTYSPKNYLIINSPLYGAIYALDKELENERKLILEVIDSPTMDIDKRSVKPKLIRQKVQDLFDLSKDNRSIANTTRQFFVILEKHVINEY